MTKMSFFENYVQDSSEFFMTKEEMLDGYLLVDTDRQKRPAASISIHDQLRAIKSVIRAQEKADDELTADINGLGSLSSHSWREEDEYIFLLQQSTYMGSAMSLTAAALYVSFVETLMTVFFQKLGADYGPQLRLVNPSFVRWHKEEHNHFLLKGNGKLTDAIAIASNIGLNLDPQALEVINLLRKYRNSMVHNSLEWPKDELVKFGLKLANFPQNWFDIATSNHEPTFFVIKKPFVEAVDAAVHKLIDDMAEFLNAMINQTDIP